MFKLGNLVIPAATAKNNNNTAAPFTIPVNIRGLWLLTTGTDVVFELVYDATGAYETSAAKGAPLTAGIAIPVPLLQFNFPPTAIACLSAYSTAGATLQVWGLWG